MGKSGREIFEKYKTIILICTGTLKVFPKFFLIFLWNCISNHSQLPFVAFRYVLLKCFVPKCGDNIKVGTNVQIIGWDKIELGSNISIHSNCYIDASGGLKIGDDVSVAHNSSILTTNHGWSDDTLPIKYNPLSFRKVIIEDDVWIGCGCRILAGTVIQSRSIIAAGAVVNRSIEGNSIYGGIPAKIIKKI